MQENTWLIKTEKKKKANFVVVVKSKKKKKKSDSTRDRTGDLECVRLT